MNTEYDEDEYIEALITAHDNGLHNADPIAALNDGCELCRERAEPLLARQQAKARWPSTHTHIYIARKAGFGGDPDLVCTICGFRIPEAMRQHAISAGAIVQDLPRYNMAIQHEGPNDPWIGAHHDLDGDWVRASDALELLTDIGSVLESLVARCDGDEGVLPDGSNIDTQEAHAILAKLEAM